MGTIATRNGLGYSERITSLHATRFQQTAEKQRVIGVMDYDDWALVLPPPEITHHCEEHGRFGDRDYRLPVEQLHNRIKSSVGGIFRAPGRRSQFSQAPRCSSHVRGPHEFLAGAYMTNFMTYRKPHWNPDFSFDFLAADQKKYRIIHGIGGTQHFCQDFGIGLSIGWGGILKRIRDYRLVNTDESSQALYDGLEQVVLGIQGWIGRTAAAAGELALTEQRPELRADLLETQRINRQIMNEPPDSFRGACQWVLWHCLMARMYDGSGSVGRLDRVLLPFYQRDLEAGILTDEEAVFHLACILVRDTGYMQLGGYDGSGLDDTIRFPI